MFVPAFPMELCEFSILMKKLLREMENYMFQAKTETKEKRYRTRDSWTL